MDESLYATAFVPFDQETRDKVACTQQTLAPTDAALYLVLDRWPD